MGTLSTSGISGQTSLGTGGAGIPGEMLIVDLNRISVKPLREFTHTYLGKTGDKTEGLLVGEYTAEIKQALGK